MVVGSQASASTCGGEPNVLFQLRALTAMYVVGLSCLLALLAQHARPPCFRADGGERAHEGRVLETNLALHARRSYVWRGARNRPATARSVWSPSAWAPCAQQLLKGPVPQHSAGCCIPRQRARRDRAWWESLRMRGDAFGMFVYHVRRQMPRRCHHATQRPNASQRTLNNPKNPNNLAACDLHILYSVAPCSAAKQLACFVTAHNRS